MCLFFSVRERLGTGLSATCLFLRLGCGFVLFDIIIIIRKDILRNKVCIRKEKTV